jgi:hypothetical protein
VNLYMKQKRPSSRDNCQEDTSDPENVKFPPDCSCVVSQSFTDSRRPRSSGIKDKLRFPVSLKTVHPRDDNRENNKSNSYKLDFSVIFKSVDALSVDYIRATSEGS